MDTPWFALAVFAPFVIFASLTPVSYAIMWVFGELVRLEHSSYTAEWEADGEPWVPDWRGYWRPPGGEPPERPWRRLLVIPDNVFAAQRCAFAWLFKTSGWMRQDRRAQRLVFRLRILVLVFALGTLGAFFAFFAGIAANLTARLT